MDAKQFHSASVIRSWGVASSEGRLGGGEVITPYLRRGLAAGLLAGLLAGMFAFAFGEPQLDRAVALEEQADSTHAHGLRLARSHRAPKNTLRAVQSKAKVPKETMR